MAEKVSYKLQIPKDVYDSLKDLADEEGITLAEVLRNGAKWVMLAKKLKDEQAKLLIKSNGDTRELVVF